jgi:hypothetical protein
MAAPLIETHNNSSPAVSYVKTSPQSIAGLLGVVNGDGTLEIEMPLPTQALDEDVFLDFMLGTDVEMHERAAATRRVKGTWRLTSMG